MKRTKLLITLALPVFLCQNIRAQSYSRLIAESQLNNNGSMFVATDSASFIYHSNVRGGDLTHTLKFDSSIYGGYGITSLFSPGITKVQQFDANNNITTIITSVNGLLSHKTLYTYNTANQVTSVIQQSWNGSSWSPLTEDLYTYSSANQLQTDEHETWDSVAFAIDSQKSYYYDTVTRLLTKEMDNYFVSGFPVYTNEYAYTYDSSTHDLLTSVQSLSDSGTLTGGFSPLKMVTYFYDSSGNLTEVEKAHYNGATSAYVPDSLYAYANFTSAHMPQTEDIKWWDSTTTTGGSWVNLIEFTNTYNTAHQLTSSTGVSWNITGFYEAAVGDPKYNYYYGSYSGTASSGVKSVAGYDGSANIYPVPAQNMLHIDLTWNEAQQATITIYDVAGRVAKQWNAPYGTQYSNTIAVNDLATGTYLVKINGTQGQIVKQIMIAR